ncbi:LysR substrate-binding domain-containing protein [Nocardia acidivorans]|uniref:LysR substrate-binding domain-containing protein n=1 Tax=Nocardia acidivorans TaxID=404580 RepID=UPI0008330F73|nr:LysR substrate-binding domain-containing protein [Nocardia acidivorans]
MTRTVKADDKGNQLTDEEFQAFFILMTVAGNETTRYAIAGGVEAFAQFPDQWARLRADPSPARTAAEEILRWTSPTKVFRRTATADTELGGQLIREGDKIMAGPAIGEEHIGVGQQLAHPAHTVVLGIAPEVSAAVRTSVLEALADVPDTVIRLSPGRTGQVLAALHAGQVDLALIGEPDDTDGIGFVRLESQPVGAVVASAIGFDDRASVGLDELVHLPYAPLGGESACTVCDRSRPRCDPLARTRVRPGTVPSTVWPMW